MWKKRYLHSIIEYFMAVFYICVYLPRKGCELCFMFTKNKKER